MLPGRMTYRMWSGSTAEGDPAQSLISLLGGR
jgi:hypothetical protein